MPTGRLRYAPAEPCEAKVSSTVLRGESGRKPRDLPGVVINRYLILAYNAFENYRVIMSTVEEIKEAIQKLSDEQRRELESWWHPTYDDWDLQMDSDAKAGKLDALADFKAGKCDEFP